MPTYNLEVREIQTIPVVGDRQNVVTRVLWTYRGTQDGRTAQIGGSTDIADDPQAPFTPYSELTHDQVASWVTNSWKPELKAIYDKAVDDLLVVQTMPLPWAPPAEAV